jgi:GDP-L-fucose synthase
MVFKGKKVLVAGGTGMIGIPLVEMLLEQGAEVRIASLDDPSRAHPQAEFYQVNLMSFENSLKVCQGMDFVFNLLGVKGSPAIATGKPASFFVPTITLNTNLMEAAWKSEVEGFLFTSSVAVYAPAEVFYEDDVWRTFPSPNDRFPGWAKRMGELQAEAYKIEHGWNRIAIVRPANVYGPYDNFDFENAMVVPSLIKRAVDGENPLIVWGNGSARRDFIHAKDVARGMLLAAEHANCEPINLGSGSGVSIKELVDTILSNLDSKPEIVWDSSKPEGDRQRIMDIARARAIGFEPQISLAQGVREVMQWYRKNRHSTAKRFDVFV